MKWRAWLITALSCLTVTAVLAGVRPRRLLRPWRSWKVFRHRVRPLPIAQARSDSWAPTRLLSGTVRSPEHLVIATEIPGRVVELPFASGDTVPKGAAILVLFNDDLEAQRTALQADLNLVNTQLERNQTLEADALVSRDQLDTLTAQTLSLTAQIAVLEARLSRTTVRAPFTGTLGIYPQRVGDLMHLSEVLTTLTGLNAERWVDFKVPQGLAELSVGDTVTIRDITGNASRPCNSHCGFRCLRRGHSHL